MPRIVAIMGSGETSPTMTGVHRALLERMGAGAEIAILDTPVGFQLNADEVTARAVAYFRESVGHKATIASMKDVETLGAADAEIALNKLRDASYIFAGPGSPTYALKQWRQTPVADLLKNRLEAGCCIVFASAAALTLGRFTVPVYEIYKVGEPPRWEEGLDLLGSVGLNVAVIPHFNNAEGGTHDTRFCYLGEERLQLLEAQLPEGYWVLGVDEHTAAILDLDAHTIEVKGLGVVTVRRGGRELRIEAGTLAPLEDLAPGTGPAVRAASAAPAAFAASGAEETPFWPKVEASKRAFERSLAERAHKAALDAVLELDDHLTEWSTETFGTDEFARAREFFREAIARLGEAAERGSRDPEESIAPLVDALLSLRAKARAEERWNDADQIRDVLVAYRIELQDSGDGTEWHLLEEND